MIQDNSQVTILASQLMGHSLQDMTTQENRSNVNSSVSSSDQDFLGVWCHDEDMKENKALWLQMRSRLFQTFTYVCIFDNQNAFHRYFKRSLKVNSIFLIVSGKYAKSLYSLGKERKKLHGVYEFQMPSDIIEYPSTTFVNIEKLFEQINTDLKRNMTAHESSSTETVQEETSHRLAMTLSLSVFNTTTNQNAFQYWTKESLEFYRFQSLTGIITKMNCDHFASKKDAFQEFRRRYSGKTKQEKDINEMEDKYEAERVIWYYTCDSFFFRAMGEVFRSEDIESIYKLRRCIIDLDKRIDHIAPNRKPEQKTVYRGKKLRSIILQQLEDNIGHILSINGFLSTTKDRQMAIEKYAGTGQDRINYKSVLFELDINDTMIIRPFADVSDPEISRFPSEEEVLFSLGSVWKIEDVILDKNVKGLWIVKLKPCIDLNHKLVQLFEQLSSADTLIPLGDVLYELGQYTKAKNFYYRILRESNLEDQIRAALYYKIGQINKVQENDIEALRNFYDAEKLLPSTATGIEPSIPQALNLHPTDTLRLRILLNMSLLYQKTDQFDEALSCFARASAIEGPDHVERAIVEYKYGLLLYNSRKYDDAREHFEKGRTLAHGHPFFDTINNAYSMVMNYLSP